MTPTQADELRYLWLPFAALFVGGWIAIASYQHRPGQITLFSPPLAAVVVGATLLGGFAPTLAKLWRDYR